MPNERIVSLKQRILDRLISELKVQLEDARRRYCIPINLLLVIYFVYANFNKIGNYENEILFGGLVWISEPIVVFGVAIVSVFPAHLVYGDFWKRHEKPFTLPHKLFYAGFTVIIYLGVFGFQIIGNLTELIRVETDEPYSLAIIMVIGTVFFVQWLANLLLKNLYNEGLIANCAKLIDKRYQDFLVNNSW